MGRVEMIERKNSLWRHYPRLARKYAFILPPSSFILPRAGVGQVEERDLARSPVGQVEERDLAGATASQ